MQSANREFILLLISKRLIVPQGTVLLIPLDRVDKTAVVEFFAQSRVDYVLGLQLRGFRIEAVLRH